MQTEVLNKIRTRIEMRAQITKDKEQKAVNGRSWGLASQLEAQVAILEEVLIYFKEEDKNTDNEKV